MWLPVVVACAQASTSCSKWGEIAIHQHVAGTPWFGMDAQTGSHMPGAQWVAGLHHQGWSAWQQHSVSGGQRRVVGGLAMDVLVQVGVDRWPQLRPGRSVGFGRGPVQSCGGRVGDLHRGGGLAHARGLSGSMDVVRLVAASQPSRIVGMSGVDVVSGRTVGHSVESRPDVVGRPAPVASLESGIASVGWRPNGWPSWAGLGPQLPTQRRLRREQPGPSRDGTRESEAAWVACGPRTAWCCRVSSLGLAMGGMTLNDWTKAVVVMGLQATSFSAVVAQMGLSEWSWDVPVDVWRTLSRAAEQGHCSWASAEAVARHVELHGKPWAAESARRIEGLDTATQRWLEGQPWWRRWAMDQVANAAQGSSASQHSWAIERSWSAHALAPTGLGIWRGKTSQAKWTCTTDHPTTWAGSLWGRRGDLRWTLGDHSAGWGQGLTIPRGRAFGTEWHVGDPGLPAPGRLTPSMQTGHHGLMRGLAGEWFRVTARLGRPLDLVMWRHCQGSSGAQTSGLTSKGGCPENPERWVLQVRLWWALITFKGLWRWSGQTKRSLATPQSDGLGATRGCFKRQAGAVGRFTSPRLLTSPRCAAWLAAPGKGVCHFR